MNHWLQSRNCTSLFYSEKSCALFAIVPRLPFVSADLPSSSNWHNHWLDISLRTFHRNIFPLSITTQTLRPMHHRANHSVQWSSQMDLGCCEPFQVSGKAPAVCWVTTKSGVCWAAHWCWQILAGNSVLSNSIGLSPGLKLKFLPQKSLQKLLSRAFKDEFLPMVLTKRWHGMYCAWLWISVSSICCQPIPPSTLLNTREPLTHTRHSPKYIEGFFLPSRIWNHQIYLYCSSLHLHSFVHPSSLDDWSWNTESIKCTQIAVMTISELRSLRAWRRCLQAPLWMIFQQRVISISRHSAPIHHLSTCTDLSSALNWDKSTHAGENTSKIRHRYSVINMWCAEVLLDADRGYLHHKMDLAGWWWWSQSYRWWAESHISSLFL